MHINLKKKSFILTFGILLILTPFFYYIFSLFVIINCERSKVLKYIFYPIHEIYKPDRRAFCNLSRLKDHEIVFLSDSTNLGRVDQTTKGISGYLEYFTNKKTLSVDLGGGNAETFNYFFDNSPFIDFSNVKYVILTLNLRAFAETSYTAAEFLDSKDRHFSKIFYNPYKIQDLIELNKLIFDAQLLEKKIINWESKNTVIDNVKIKKKIKTDNNVLKINEYFKTYMGKIELNHPVLLSILKLKKKLNKMGIKLIVYSTPINISEAMNEFRNDNKYSLNNKSFEDRIILNLLNIKNSFYLNDIPFLDLTFQIKNIKTFYDRDYNISSEHIDYKGRKFVADKLQQFINLNKI